MNDGEENTTKIRHRAADFQGVSKKLCLLRKAPRQKREISEGIE